MTNDPIKIVYDPPPIPIRSFDWRAYRDSYDLGSLLGYGPTSEAAIADLLDKEEERAGTKTVIKDYGPDDPISDVFNQYRIGDVITMPDGRRWRRAALAQWELVE